MSLPQHYIVSVINKKTWQWILQKSCFQRRQKLTWILRISNKAYAWVETNPARSASASLMGPVAMVIRQSPKLINKKKCPFFSVTKIWRRATIIYYWKQFNGVIKKRKKLMTMKVRRVMIRNNTNEHSNIYLFSTQSSIDQNAYFHWMQGQFVWWTCVQGSILWEHGDQYSDKERTVKYMIKMFHYQRC